MPDESISAGTETTVWFIMFHPRPDIINMHLSRERETRRQEAAPDFEFVIPYLQLNRAEYRDEDESDGSDTAPLRRGWQKKREEKQQQLNDARLNNNLRNYLHRFVFIKSTRPEVDVMLRQSWNTRGLYRLAYRYTHSGIPLAISDSQMQPLLRTLALYQHKFSFTDYSATILSAGRVEICEGSFSGTVATVLQVRNSGEETRLTLGIPVFNKEFMLQLKDVDAKHVKILGGSIDSFLQPYFLDELEKDLLGILRMRVRRMEDNRLGKVNQSVLDSYGNIFALSFDDASRQKHFSALLLLYAVLLRDAPMKAYWLDKVSQLLPDPEHPSTDEDAFLFAVLFVATRKGPYRKTAKTYVQSVTVALPSLPVLMQIIKDINTR